MIENWLKPLDVRNILKGTHTSNECITHCLACYEKSMPKLTDYKLIIVGTDEKNANIVRKFLYNYAFPFKNLKIADIGNFIQPKHETLLAVLKELLSLGLIPIVIGGEVEESRSLFTAHTKLKTNFSACIIDNKIDFYDPQHHLTLFFDHYHQNIASINFLGYQSHLTMPSALARLEEHKFEYARLGKMRSDWENTETILRSAHSVVLNMAAVRQSDAPATPSPSPNGLYAEEACQAARYAGMNDKLSSFGVFGYVPESDNAAQQTAQLVAEVIWYFLEGFSNRKNDYPISTDGLIEFAIPSAKLQHETITFWKSSKSGRWWFEVIAKKRKTEKTPRQYLVPCTYADYQLACTGELSDRVLSALAKFG